MSYHSIGSPYKPPAETQTRVERGYLLSFFLFVSVCTGVSAALNIATTVAVILLRDYGPNGASFDCMLHWIVQLYEVIICVGIVMVEMEITEALGSISILQAWTTRGLTYIFIALIILEDRKDLEPTLFSCVVISSLSLLSFGLVYFSMGVMCLKRVRDSKMARYIQLLSHFEVQNVIRNSMNSSHSLSGMSEQQQQQTYPDA